MARKSKKERDNAKAGAVVSSSHVPPSEVLSILVRHLKEDHNYTLSQIQGLLKKEIVIPVSIFSRKLSCLETITKYLIENLSIKNKEVARILNRNIRTIWTTYNNSVKKSPKRLPESESRYSVPVSEFRNRKYSVMETIVMYLKEHFSLGFHEIAALLKRNDSTIWTVYSRALKKSKK